MSQIPSGKKPGFGCLGCLGRTVIIFLLGCALVFLIEAVFTPWGFFLGGHFHVIPQWQGWGKIQTPTGETYILFVRIFPSIHTHSRLSYASLNGLGYLCTPRHERFRLKVGGTMDKRWAPTHKGSGFTCIC